MCVCVCACVCACLCARRFSLTTGNLGFFQLPGSGANISRDRAKMKVSLMALWVSITTIVTYVMFITVNFYVIYNYYDFDSDENKKNTADILILVRDLSIALTVSVNVVFYSCFCENFRDVIKRRCLTVGSSLTAESHAHSPAVINLPPPSD